MIDSLMGIARSHFGHSATHKPLTGIVDATIPGRKKQLAVRAITWETK
jgi:hypothetical protein